METIGDRIKIVRKDECLMTQAEFAEVLGVTNAHISKIEKGLTVPSCCLPRKIQKSDTQNTKKFTLGKKTAS